MNILVIYFSQTGQIRDIVQSITSGMRNVNIDWHAIQLKEPFPYPWNAKRFFDAMPESHLLIPQEIEPMQFDASKNYDLVILGYQPWFLAPSIPTTSFLKSEYANVLKNKSVVTVIGSRNMWIRAQEKTKKMIQDVGGKLVGNIVFEDKHGNMASTISIIKWLFKGNKKPTMWSPAAGVSDEDIQNASRFGSIIQNAAVQQQLPNLQHQLLAADAVMLKPNLIILEKNGVASFPKFAHKIIAKGKPGAPARRPIVAVFKYLLIVSIFVLSPITGGIAKIKTAIKKKELDEAANYFKGVSYLPNKI
jgi:hypothetical protein